MGSVPVALYLLGRNEAETWLCGFGAILDEFSPTEVAAKGLSALGAGLAVVSSTHKNQTQATHPILPGDTRGSLACVL